MAIAQGKLFRLSSKARGLQSLGFIALCYASTASPSFAQAKPDEIKIVAPVVDKAAGKVTMPASFWNTREADWVEVAICGRPSDFLHETVLSMTTTRTLLEQAIRDAGCRDGDAWVDSVNDFPRVRGDQFLVLLEFEREGKAEIFSLDELLTFRGWNVSLGPFGFMFRGDPDRAGKAPATAATMDNDGARILRDDPQIALVFKGLQSMTQTFADHPLAYVEDGWLWAPIERARNLALLPGEVFDSNGKISVKLTLQRVTQTELLQKSAAVWHDKNFAQHMLAQSGVAAWIDKNKAEYWSLREEARVLLGIKPELRDAQKEHAILGRSAVLAAQLQADYAQLDAEWTRWAADHAAFKTDDPRQAESYKQQAARWRQYMDLALEQSQQLAFAQSAVYAQKELVLKGPASQAEAQLTILRARETEARSRALIAASGQAVEYWQAEARNIAIAQVNEVWAQNIRAQLALAQSRITAGESGVVYAQAQLATAVDAERVKTLHADYLLTGLQMIRAESNLSLIQLDFEISKRKGINPNDPQLSSLQSSRDQLNQKIKDLDQAIKANP